MSLEKAGGSGEAELCKYALPCEEVILTVVTGF